MKYPPGGFLLYFPDGNGRFTLQICVGQLWVPGSSHDAVSFRSTDLWTHIGEGFIPVFGKCEIAQASGMSHRMEIVRNALC